MVSNIILILLALIIVCDSYIPAKIKTTAINNQRETTQLFYAKLETINGQQIFPVLTFESPNKRYKYENISSLSFPAQFGNGVYKAVDTLAQMVSLPRGQNETKKFLPIQAALQKIQKDMEFLDDVAGRTPQLSTAEFVVLLTTVVVSGLSPAAFSAKVAELLVPSMAAISAAIGISAEYAGKVAVANGKETAALAIQATAESEVLLAQAERIKAVLPLCVGIATTASAFALLAPTFVAELIKKYECTPPTEVFLIFPLIAVLAAAIAGLATQESLGLATISIGTGNRRFASSNSVGRTWLSATEQVLANSKRVSNKWSSFAYGVAPAPVISALFPGSLSLKAIVCAAIAAVQAAYYLAIAEYSIAEATNAVALKARAAAVADTYANQGSRSGAILPFTSALGGLCAAASAAAIELLPLVPTPELQSLLAVIFPSAAALFAAAASVSKARCEVDSAAANAVAAQGMTGESNSETKSPAELVQELVQLTVTSSYSTFIMKFKKIKKMVKTGTIWTKIGKWMKNRWNAKTNALRSFMATSFGSNSNNNNNINNNSNGNNRNRDSSNADTSYIQISSESAVQ